MNNDGSSIASDLAEHVPSPGGKEPSFDVGAVIISGPRTASFERLPLAVPDPREAVIRVELCGICTPEQRVYRGDRKSYPYWGGHELCGVIERIPEGLDSCLQPGRRVAVALMGRCGACHECRSGRDNHCAYLHPELTHSLPVGPRGFSDRLTVPAYKLFAVPECVPVETAALAEPVACVLHSVRRGYPQAGEVALVLGAGTMGLLHTIVLQFHGCRVVVVDDDETARDAAAAAGAVVAETGLLHDPAGLRVLAGGREPDLAFCTRFGARAIGTAARVVARGGRIVLYQSIRDDDAFTISANLLHYQEVQIIGTIAQTARDMADAVSLLAAYPTRFSCLRTMTFPASRPVEAFELALRPEINRVMLDFRMP